MDSVSTRQSVALTPIICLVVAVVVFALSVVSAVDAIRTVPPMPREPAVAAPQPPAGPIRELPPRPSQLTIEVTGREFQWNYRLAGYDGELDTPDDIRVQDELHLPLECDVEFLVKSDDFVYTLSIPDLGLRKIAIPELVYHLQFRTAQPGTFEVVADPLCGVRWFHDEDMGRIVIESPAAFQTWYGSIH